MVDTNLLLVLLVGLVDKAHVEVFKRTRQYTAADFDLLLRVLGQFDVVLVTPNILTELSNLAAHLDTARKDRCFRRLAALLAAWEERHVPASAVVADAAFLRLGLTDATSLKAADPAVPVLTDDLDLYLARAHAKAEVINFTHLRARDWELS